MGARLALDVYQGCHVDLDYAARHVFVRMCLSALDHDPEPRYFGGWTELALALNLHGSDGTNQRKVRGHIFKLHDDDAITGHKRGGIRSAHGRNAHYRLWPRDRAERLPDGFHKEPCWLCRPTTG